MRRTGILIAIGIATTTSTEAEAKGCIKGEFVGGVAGHYVGDGHALI